MKWADRMRVRVHAGANSLGNLGVELFHYLALFGIGAITVYAGITTFIDMLHQDKISVDDILLLFIYLELLAMSGIYFRTNHMPLRFLLYIGVTALIRLLISDVSHHKSPDEGILYLTGGGGGAPFRFDSRSAICLGPVPVSKREDRLTAH